MDMPHKRILVCDDDDQVRNMFRQAFERCGYAVLTAESAEEALEIMSETPCNVLFLDLNLPAMNGVELCRIVREKWPMAIPFAVTGYATLYELSDCREAGFEDYFTKPVRMSVLRNAAEQAFEKLERWRAR